MATKSSTRLDVMNFLNEVAIDYPDATSFASGRPAEQFFHLEGWLSGVEGFVQERAQAQRMTLPSVRLQLAQYGRTNGVINDLVAKQTARDDGVSCDPDRIIVTAGCQEAIALCMHALFEDSDDVLLLRDPTYIGATGIADMTRVQIAPVRNLEELDVTVSQLRRTGKRPRALYVIPDFDNPTGEVLSVEQRKRVLESCAANEIVVLEDNPYGMFRYQGQSLPTMFSLDQHGSVIYLGTYSKTLCPALRVGFMALPDHLFGNREAATALLDRISKLKSFVTVNTSQIMQAVVGGVLLAEGMTLARVVAPAIEFYRQNRDAMLASLDRYLPAGVEWNRPEGGFFLTVKLPFSFGREELARCASEFRVLAMPLSFFALGDGLSESVRLSFSSVGTAEIAPGIERFAQFVKERSKP